MSEPLFLLGVFALLVIAVVVALWPRRGLVARFGRSYRAGLRVEMEDALKHLYKYARHGRTASVESVAGALEVSRATAARILTELREAHLVGGDDLTDLTEEGRQYALRIIRTHRLWERYLADRTGVAPGEWHEQAEAQEHRLSQEAVEALDARLGRPRYDPHGDPIPTAAGDMPVARGVPLTHLEPGDQALITHLEDEPRELFDQLVRSGLSPEMRLRVRSADSRGMEIRVDGRDVHLDPATAANVTVIVTDGEVGGEDPEWDGLTLEDIALGEAAEVVELSPACQGTQRRRLLDLGVVPGTPVTHELSAAGRDPAAFRIRGALVALRREQQRWIRIRRGDEAAA